MSARRFNKVKKMNYNICKCSECENKFMEILIRSDQCPLAYCNGILTRIKVNKEEIENETTN